MITESGLYQIQRYFEEMPSSGSHCSPTEPESMVKRVSGIPLCVITISAGSLMGGGVANLGTHGWNTLESTLNYLFQQIFNSKIFFSNLYIDCLNCQ